VHRAVSTGHVPPLVTMAAILAVIWDLPKPALPAMMLSLPCAIRPSQSHETGLALDFGQPPHGERTRHVRGCAVRRSLRIDRTVSDFDEYFGDVQSKRYRCPPILLERHAGASALKLRCRRRPGSSARCQSGTPCANPRIAPKITHRFPRRGSLCTW
jgi:hypothetical protein